MRGNLRSQGAGDAIRFVDDTGKTVVTYSELKAWDTDGRSLPTQLHANGNHVRLSVDDRGARYPITIDPLVQQAYLKTTTIGSVQAGDRFGGSVSLSGDTLVVSALGEDSSSLGVNSTPNEGATDAGAAFVFVRSGATWTQQAYLKPAAVGSTQAGDQFGISVSISGDTIVIGATGESSSTLGVNSIANEGSRNSGAAYVFHRTAGVWTQQAYLKPAAVGSNQDGDQMGSSVAVSGDTIVVGSFFENGSGVGVNSTPNESSFGAGAAYVYARTGSVWSQQAYLKPAAVGSTQSEDFFGNSVAISGDTIVVGAVLERSSSTGVNSTPNEGASGAGAAYVFVRNGSTWSQQAYLKPTAVGTTQAGDQFGNLVAISGDTIVVGAIGEDSASVGINSTPDESGNLAGAAYVFVRNAGVWTQQAYLKPAAAGTTQAGDQFGQSVAISGDTLIVGADMEDGAGLGTNSTPDEGAANAGAAYVYTRTGGVWTQQAYLKPASVGTTQAGDRFGFSVAASDGQVVVGAFFEDGSSPGVNGVPDEAATTAGAVYTFAATGGPAITEVIDAGSLRPEIAASAWVTIKGTSLAPLTRIWVDSDFVQGRLPTAVEGVSVTIDGKPAAVYYISPTQINVLSSTIRAGSVEVVVTTPEGSTTFTATVKDRTPSWFMLDPENRKYVAAVNADGTIVGKVGLYPSAPNFTKPLPAKGRALIYGTSWGVTSPPVPEGVVFSGAYTIAGATIKIGGLAVAVEFAGVVTPGLFQFNIVAPDLPAGDYLIEGTINGVGTQPGSYITLGPAQ